MNNHKFFAVLETAELFTGITREEMQQVLECLSARRQTYAANDYILSVADPVPEVGIVLAGNVMVLKEDYWGNRAILAKMGSGDMFGEAFACAQVEKLPVSVAAVRPSEILWIRYQQIVTICSSVCRFHTRLVRNMLRILAQKNVMLTGKVEHMVKRTTREKLLSYLSAQAVQNAAQDGGHKRFSIPLNRQELADYLSVDRSAMSNELCKLRDAGILRFYKNEFEFLTQDFKP